MNTFFNNLVVQLSQRPESKNIKHVSKEDYEVFCKEFVFDKLRGTNFGVAFCKRFKIIDTALLLNRSDENTRQYIKDVGYIK